MSAMKNIGDVVRENLEQLLKRDKQLDSMLLKTNAMSQLSYSVSIKVAWSFSSHAKRGLMLRNQDIYYGRPL